MNQLLKKALKYNVLKPDEEIELAIRISEGDVEAKELFVLSNIRLVLKIAKQYENKKVPYEDLCSVGIIGLYKALNNFDYTKGKFSGFAWFYIEGAIIKEIQNSSKLSLNTADVENLKKIRKAINNLTQKYKRSPTINELVKETEIPKEKLEGYLVTNPDDVISLNDQLADDLFVEDTIADKDPNVEFVNTVYWLFNELNLEEKVLLIEEFELNYQKYLIQSEINKYNEVLKQLNKKSKSQKQHMLNKLKSKLRNQL